MRNEFRNLRLKQLDRTLERFHAVAKTPRPQKGWLRAIREAMGISASEVARTLKTSRQLPVQLEKAEAEDRITLKSLRTAANALGCDLVYALVPRTNTLRDLVEERARAQAKKTKAVKEKPKRVSLPKGMQPADVDLTTALRLLSRIPLGSFVVITR